MDVRIGVGRAVCRDEQLCPVEVGRVHGHELDLAGPLAQLGGHRGTCRRSRGRFAVELVHLVAGAAGVCRGSSGSGLFLLVLQHGLLVIRRSLALFKGDGTGGAAGQAVAKAVAVIVPHEFCLAVDQADGPFVAGRDTRTAAIALFLVYVNDFSNHKRILLAFSVHSIL